MKRLILILMLLCSPQLWAVAYNSCANISSGNWNVPASWALSATPTVCNLVVVPGASDTATITTGFSMTVSDAEAASTLATSGSGSLEIQAGGTLTVTTTVTLAGTGTLLIDGGGTGNVGTILTVGAGTTVHVTGTSAVLWVQTGASTTTVDLVMTGSSATNATLTIDTGGHMYLAGKWTIMKSTVTNLYGANPVTFCPKQAASSTICNTTGTATALTWTHGGTAATNYAVVNLCPTSSCNTWTTAITQTLAGPTELGTCSAGAKIDQIPAASATSGDRKSTRLNSSHLGISYAVFCLKKKKTVTSRRLYVFLLAAFAVRVFDTAWLTIAGVGSPMKKPTAASSAVTGGKICFFLNPPSTPRFPPSPTAALFST